MLPSTIDVLKSVLRADPTLSPAERVSLMARLRQKPEDPRAEDAAKSGVRIIRRCEAARLLSCSTRTLDKLATAGLLPRRKLPGRVRASGFLASDVDALIATRMLRPAA
ncbi:MAG: helix-turn-helix domain-containing protein [Verrucomicrobia bacterium]|nr:helix-turn-helix domain-containing protein [Verrucomicrobiota bacterium]